MKNDVKCAEGKKFSPSLEIADFELAQVVGGIGEVRSLSAKSQSLKVSPANTPSTWVKQYLKAPPVSVLDSSSEERR